jgi:hypothetical protein
MGERRRYVVGVDEHRPERVEIDGFELHVEPVSDASAELHTALPPRIESWRRRSAMGAILTGFALGLREALEPEREEPAIVAQVSGEPVGDLPVQAQLDEVSPRESVVTIRPWLLEDRPATAGPPEPAAGSERPKPKRRR